MCTCTTYTIIIRPGQSRIIRRILIVLKKWLTFSKDTGRWPKRNQYTMTMTETMLHTNSSKLRLELKNFFMFLQATILKIWSVINKIVKNRSRPICMYMGFVNAIASWIVILPFPYCSRRAFVDANRFDKLLIQQVSKKFSTVIKTLKILYAWKRRKRILRQ